MLNHDQWVAKLAHGENVTMLYYEDDYLTVKAFDALRAAVGEGADWQPLAQKPEKLREIKTEAEAHCIREACRDYSRGLCKDAARDS